MNRNDALGGALIFLFGALTVYLSLKMPLGTFRAAGPGLFPLCLGLLLVVLSSIFTLATVMRLRRDGKREGKTPEDSRFSKAGARSSWRLSLLRPVSWNIWVTPLTAFIVVMALLQILGWPLLAPEFAHLAGGRRGFPLSLCAVAADSVSAGVLGAVRDDFMLESLQQLAGGFGIATTVPNLFYCLIGAIVGTLIGVLPGIGPIAGIALLIPATFSLNPTSAIIMLAGIYYGAMYGGSTTSILLNVPGETASVITCIDGYQMAQKGRAGPALAICAIGSFIAGSLGLFGLVAFLPRPWPRRRWPSGRPSSSRSWCSGSSS